MRFPAILLFGALASLPAIVPGSAYGQSQTPAATPQPAATSTTTQTVAPAQGKAASVPNAKPATVKVWTNDDLPYLRSGHGVSIVGDRSPQNISATSRASSQDKNAAWYRNQVATLREEIDKLDAKIAKLKAFLNGENVGEQASMHPKMVPTPQDQLKQAQARRQVDWEKMEDLIDRARHNGIEPGALR